MSTRANSSNFKCVYFDPKQTPFSKSKTEQAVYLFWREEWQKTLAQVAPGSSLFSDDFSRHDEIVAILIEGVVAGLFGLNWYWPQSEIERDLRYWTNYPSWMSSFLASRASEVTMSMSYLTVAPSFRRASTGWPVSDWLVGLAIQRFLESKAEVLLTYTRNDRKTHELGYRHGGVTLDGEHQVHGIGSDVLLFDRRSVVAAAENFSKEVVELHQNCKAFSRSKKAAHASILEGKVESSILATQNGRKHL